MTKDYILRGTVHHNNFRVFAVNSTNCVQTMRDLQDLSPIATLLSGRMISATAMLSWDLKEEESEITMRIDCEGDFQGAIVICTQNGFLRGYTKNPHLFYETKEDNFNVGKSIGKGTLTISRDRKGTRSYFSSIELISGEIAEDLAYYFQQSEQIPTAVNLGILIDKEAKVRSAGGFIIQQLPYADKKIADVIYENIAQTPNLSDLMDMGLSIPEILSRFVFKELQWQINEEKEIAYRCNCSYEQFSKALLLLGKDELQSLKEGIKPVCLYCHKEYNFSYEDIQSLMEQL
ncbi:MAG TPA: Hsp33 family molecular chaperone HslO [Candidatus Cloacimonas sp.]|nr:Hsp33 family molecular chaperone HslO [Candidatus Cloacimonas sp.]HPA24069.1 Hsp33 family molecular chaperone HslO [Candidatus Cloacimonas sp.]HPH93304.1 Hsp33 family molecular chaperone HslO [Candidatus Cloacimonas sp.]HQC31142.1 Hsp33 family molecular chaperone HslO [Candidatus Cloacimonas sp.]HQM03130.1 Hsp33 family molecular chaperone HslO [Candidatus Cloacimonas sp.]